VPYVPTLGVKENVVPTTVAVPFVPCAVTPTLVAIAPAAVLVIKGAIPVVAVHGPAAQKVADDVMAATVGFGGFPMVTVTVALFEAAPLGPDAL
jgi:hypothetical protein